MAKRIVLDCDSCGEPGAETCGPFDLGDGPKEPDLCEACQEKLGLPRLLMLASEYGVSEQKEASGAVMTRPAGERQPTQCPKCDAAFWAGRMGAVDHLQRIHGLTLNEACHAVPFEGEGADCPYDCGYYGAKRGLPAHVRWHEGQQHEEVA